MSILDNAVNSIVIGVEDYNSPDLRRNVSAVRNISAGLLLLYKEKLRQLSPDHDKELLLKNNLLPVLTSGGDLIFQGKGKNTVGVDSIKKRFESLDIHVDWKVFDEMNRLRNDVEHYYTNKTSVAIREIVAKSFVLIRDFVVNDFESKPKNSFRQSLLEYIIKCFKCV